jgi:hypothetical protein
MASVITLARYTGPKSIEFWLMAAETGAVSRVLEAAHLDYREFDVGKIRYRLWVDKYAAEKKLPRTAVLSTGGYIRGPFLVYRLESAGPASMREQDVAALGSLIC